MPGQVAVHRCAYGTPNGIGFPFDAPLVSAIAFYDKGGPYKNTYLFREQIDPYAPAGSTEQSHDLREIATFYDPVFRAKNDVFQFNMQWAPSDRLTLYSQSLYMRDSYYASEDFFRSNSASGLMANPTGRQVVDSWAPYLGVSPDGYGTFKDPQLGELDQLAAIDISQRQLIEIVFGSAQGDAASAARRVHPSPRAWAAGERGGECSGAFTRCGGHACRARGTGSASGDRQDREARRTCQRIAPLSWRRRIGWPAV
ncbi:MAG: hypothetical protein WDN44_04015 [Sphingomonas sp.]